MSCNGRGQESQTSLQSNVASLEAFVVGNHIINLTKDDLLHVISSVYPINYYITSNDT